jgi:hypothetical protein
MNQHLSSEQMSRWMIGERTSEEDRHARECPRCSAELDRQERALLLFRDSGRRWSDHWYFAASQNGPQYAQGGVGQRSRPWDKLSVVGALAACVFLGALLIHRAAPLSEPAEAPYRISAEPFVQIPYVAPLAPYERTEVMRMDVPVAALIAAGFEVHVADPAAIIRADVLVGQDGRPHAIRLISGFIPKS